MVSPIPSLNYLCLQIYPFLQIYLFVLVRKRTANVLDVWASLDAQNYTYALLSYV
jgi:hypothetical protein